MYEITRKNCYKCDIETINDNDNINFWINLRDFEIENENNWDSLFVMSENSDKIKYRKQLTIGTSFQPDRIFIRNDLFEKVLDRYDAQTDELGIIKKKLGICIYGNIPLKLNEEYVNEKNVNEENVNNENVNNEKNVEHEIHDNLYLATFSKVVDNQAFNDIFGYSFSDLANKLINTKDLVKNKALVDNLIKNKEVLNVKDEIEGYLVKLESKRVNLIAASELLIDFNKKI